MTRNALSSDPPPPTPREAAIDRAKSRAADHHVAAWKHAAASRSDWLPWIEDEPAPPDRRLLVLAVADYLEQTRAALPKPRRGEIRVKKIAWMRENADWYVSQRAGELGAAPSRRRYIQFLRLFIPVDNPRYVPTARDLEAYKRALADYDAAASLTVQTATGKSLGLPPGIRAGYPVNSPQHMALASPDDDVEGFISLAVETDGGGRIDRGFAPISPHHAQRGQTQFLPKGRTEPLPRHLPIRPAKMQAQDHQAERLLPLLMSLAIEMLHDENAVLVPKDARTNDGYHHDMVGCAWEAIMIEVHEKRGGGLMSDAQAVVLAKRRMRDLLHRERIGVKQSSWNHYRTKAERELGRATTHHDDVLPQHRLAPLSIDDKDVSLEAVLGSDDGPSPTDLAWWNTQEAAHLTDRDWKILIGLETKATVEELALEVGIKPGTLKRYRTRLLSELVPLLQDRLDEHAR